MKLHSLSFRPQSLCCLRKRAESTYPELCGTQLIVDEVRKVRASDSNLSRYLDHTDLLSILLILKQYYHMLPPPLWNTQWNPYTLMLCGTTSTNSLINGTVICFFFQLKQIKISKGKSKVLMHAKKVYGGVQV